MLQYVSASLVATTTNADVLKQILPAQAAATMALVATTKVLHIYVHSWSHMCMHYNEYCSTDDTIPCNHGDMQYIGKCRGKDTDEEHRGMQKITS